MRISANTILGSLPQFNNKKIELMSDQSVNDIMIGMKKAHKDFANDYDKICIYFLGNTVEKTCKNIFNFLRANTNYFIESEDLQTVKSPAAILHTKNIDCKNYALFAGGILDAINRNGLQDIPFCYRYVSNKMFDSSPNHVFIVALDNDREIWIDPIPEVLHFDYRLPFFYNVDKNFNTMSLVKISGAGQQIGFVLPIGLDDVKNITGIITNLFGNRPNPNDWKGWEKQDKERGSAVGVTAQHWTINDGDSIPNEALNIIRWIENYGLQTVVGYDSWHKKNVTIQDLANKLQRGGFPQEAQLFLQQTNSILNKIKPVNTPVNTNRNILSDIFSSLPARNNTGTGLNMINQPGQTQTARMSTPVLIGLAAIAAYFVFKKK